MWNRARMNPTPVQLASGTMPAVWVDEQQGTFYQQQPAAINLQTEQHLQNFDQNQVQFQQQQMYYHHHQLQLKNQQQQQVNYDQHQNQQQMNYHHHQEQMYYQQMQQQMNCHTQELIHYQQQQRSYHQQLQPTQLQPGQQQLNCQFSQQQAMLMQLRHHQQYTQDEKRTLLVGGLQHWMDEAYINYCFSRTFPVCSISLIWNKLLGSSEGYCYVEFASHTAAERVLNSYNSLLMPHTQCQPFRLQWASSTNRQNSFRPNTSTEYSACEGDLAPRGVIEHGVLQEKPEKGPKYSLWEGDLALGFITEPGLLQENP